MGKVREVYATEELDHTTLRLRRVDRDVLLEALDGRKVTASIRLGRIDDIDSVIDAKFAVGKIESAIADLLPLGWLVRDDRGAAMRKRHGIRKRRKRAGVE